MIWDVWFGGVSSDLGMARYFNPKQFECCQSELFHKWRIYQKAYREFSTVSVPWKMPCGIDCLSVYQPYSTYAAFSTNTWSTLKVERLSTGKRFTLSREVLQTRNISAERYAWRTIIESREVRECSESYPWMISGPTQVMMKQILSIFFLLL